MNLCHFFSLCVYVFRFYSLLTAEMIWVRDREGRGSSIRGALADRGARWGSRGTGLGESAQLICMTMQALVVELYVELNLIV